MHGTSFKDNKEIYCEIFDLKNPEKNISHWKSRNFDRNFNFFIENVNFLLRNFRLHFYSTENIDFCPENVHLNIKEGHLST